MESEIAVGGMSPHGVDASQSQLRTEVARGELTDRAPLRDYIVLLGLFAVIAVIIIAMATTAVDVSI